MPKGSLTKRPAALRVRRFPRVKPLALVAVSLAIGLLGYYAFLGVRYWGASRQMASYELEIGRLQQSLERQLPNGQRPASGLPSLETRQERVRAVFRERRTEELMPLLAATAATAGVELRTMEIGESSTAVKEGATFRVQPVAVVLQGDVADVYRFLAWLGQQAPTLAVSDVRMTNLQSALSARFQLLFYALPAGAGGAEAN